MFALFLKYGQFFLTKSHQATRTHADTRTKPLEDDRALSAAVTLCWGTSLLAPALPRCLALFYLGWSRVSLFGAAPPAAAGSILHSRLDSQRFTAAIAVYCINHLFCLLRFAPSWTCCHVVYRIVNLTF